MSIDQQFVKYVVSSLVEHADDIIVERSIDERGVLLTLVVHPDDLGRVIGRRGVTAQSLRNLLRALGMKNDARYNLKIMNTDEYNTNTSSDENRQPVEEIQGDSVENESDFLKRSRKELAELDDDSI